MIKKLTLLKFRNAMIQIIYFWNAKYPNKYNFEMQWSKYKAIWLNIGPVSILWLQESILLSVLEKNTEANEFQISNFESCLSLRQDQGI